MEKEHRKNIRFRGLYRHSLDGKGRIPLPSVFRKVLERIKERALVLTKGYDGEIDVYTLEAWQAFEDEVLLSVPYYKKEMRRFVRRKVSMASEVNLDAQGRILIPSFLLNYAELTKEAIISGAVDHIEIWSPERFDIYMKEADKYHENDADGLLYFLNSRGKNED